MSDEPELPARGAEPPPPIELDPRPGVVRLNRRAVFVAGALATAVLLAAVFTLSGRSREVAERREQAASGRAEPRRFWDDQPDGVPRLPPAPAVDPAAEPAPPADPHQPAPPQLEGAAAPVLLESGASQPAQTLERAYTSRPVVFEGREDAPGAAVRRGGPAGRPPGAPAAVDAAGVLRAARDLYPPEPGAQDGVAQNLQHEKLEFLRSAAMDAGDEILPHRLRPALSPYEVKAGSLVPAVLITQANSDLPGQLIAQVRENVFDTATGAHLLIPQGTRAIGVYHSLVAYGQERILVAWQRMIFPDGSSLNLGSMPGTDQAGAAGFEDQVDRHTLRTFGSAVLLSAISAGVQLSQGTFGGRDGGQTDTRDLREILAAALGQNLGELGTETARRNLNVQPTLEIRPGYRFHIAVMQDLVLPGPYPAS